MVAIFLASDSDLRDVFEGNTNKNLRCGTCCARVAKHCTDPSLRKRIPQQGSNSKVGHVNSSDGQQFFCIAWLKTW